MPKLRSNHTAEDETHVFFPLPDEMLVHIASSLDNKDKAIWSRTSRGFHQFFQKDLEKAAIEKLNPHVLRGEESDALSMIASYPARLCSRGTAHDYSGRPFNDVTPFQAALLSHDVVMWTKIEPFFNKLPNGQAEKARQFKELFPNGFPEQTPYDFNALIQTIINSSDTDVQRLLNNPFDTTSELGQAMQTFRDEFTTTSMKETFFNSQHLIKALDIYCEKYSSWSMNQRCLFWNQVIGFSQRFLPAYYAQVFCQGLYKVAEDGNPLTRSLQFDNHFDNHSINFFPLKPSSDLGFQFGVYTYHSADLRGGWIADAVRSMQTSFQKLCSANRKALSKLDHQLTSRSYCTIS